MNKKSCVYRIEYTTDPDHSTWNSWEDKTYASFRECKKKAWEYAQSEAEYNRSSDLDKHRLLIQGIRIVQEYTETTTETITEFLF